MKVAIIGTRICNQDCYQIVCDNIPVGCSEVISGGAEGIDALAKRFAKDHSIRLTEYPPEYNKYGKNAPILRNIRIVNSCDYVLTFWDGKSKGTQMTISYCLKKQIPLKIIMLKKTAKKENNNLTSSEI